MGSKRTLSRQLSTLVFGFALLLSVPIGAVNLWIGERRESARQQEQVAAVLSLFGTQLRKAVWDFDEPAVRQILSGLRNFPALQSAEVTSPDMRVAYIKPGTNPELAGPVQRFELRAPERELVIGQLQLRLDSEALRRQLLYDVRDLMLLFGSELFIVVVLIFALMRRRVTEPVLALSEHVQRMTLERLAEPAPVPRTRPNELHELARGVTRLQHALRDHVAQRDEIARTLQQSEARLKLIADSIPNQLWSALPEGKLDYVSQRALDYFGASVEQLTNNSWQSLVHPDDWDDCAARWVHSLESGAPYHADLRLRRFDGQYRWHSSLALPQRDAHGAILKWFGSTTDVTDRKRSEEALLQSQKMNAIGQLAGGVAHDFNNQLAVILGLAELLEHQVQDPELRECTDGILQAANRCRDLTKNLLAFSRKRQLERVAVDVHALIDETIRLLERSLDKRIKVARQLNAQRAVIRGDPSQLQNALLNLALNARDAMPHGGSITFSTELREGDLPEGTYLSVCVSDTGTGMSDEVKSHIFEPFFTTKPVGQGTGMGMASVHGTVESHAGTIHVHSELGRGTAIRIDLPLAELQSARRDSARPRRTSASPVGLRILVVDDESAVGNMLARSLEGAGHHVTVAASGEEALRCYADGGSAFDLVVLDVVMPGLGGAETFKRLRAIRSDAKIVLCSGFGAEGAADALLEAGARGLLQKPFEQHQLLAAIAATMDG